MVLCDSELSHSLENAELQKNRPQRYDLNVYMQFHFIELLAFNSAEYVPYFPLFHSNFVQSKTPIP